MSVRIGSRDDPTSSRVFRAIPMVLLEYPAEVLLATWSTLSGITFLIGVADPDSITTVLPPALQYLWAASLTLAGATIIGGLWLHHFGTSVARGLSLLGASCLVYAGVLFYYGGSRSIPAGPLMVAICLLCYLRGWWLRVRERILAVLNRESRE